MVKRDKNFCWTLWTSGGMLLPNPIRFDLKELPSARKGNV